MKKWLSLFVLPCVFSLAVAAQVPHSSHVWLIAEENHSLEEAEASMPFLMSLGTQYGIANQYYADMHNSISALMHLTAGQTVTTNDSTPDTFNVDNIVRHLVKKGLTFRSYQEGLPSPGFLGLWAGRYVKRHNPLAYFTDVADSNLRYDLVPLPQLATDLANNRTANFNYVTPNLDDDAHDGSMQAADQWLSQIAPQILALPEFQPGGDGLLFVVFDEGNLGSNIDFRCNATTSNKDCGGRVLAVVAGPNVRSGFQSKTFYNHESLLATLCQALGTDGCPGAADKAQPMADFFVAPLVASPATVTVGVGQKAQYSLSVLPVNGFYENDVKLSCGKLPAGVQCSFSPTTVQPGNSPATATLTLSFGAQSAGLLRPLGRRLEWQLGFWLCLPGLALIPAAGRRRRLWLALAIAVTIAVLLFSVGCGGVSGGSASQTSGAFSGQSYSINVTATSSSAFFSIPVKLQVTN